MIKMGAGIILVCPKNKSVLFVLRNDTVPTWAILGGGVDQYESPIQAAKRELLEESGFMENKDYKIHSMDPVYVYKNSTFNYYSFLAVTENEIMPVLNYENKEYIWVTLDKLPEPLHFGLDEIFKNPRALKKIKKLMS